MNHGNCPWFLLLVPQDESEVGDQPIVVKAEDHSRKTRHHLESFQGRTIRVQCHQVPVLSFQFLHNVVESIKVNDLLAGIV